MDYELSENDILEIERELENRLTSLKIDDLEEEKSSDEESGKSSYHLI